MKIRFPKQNAKIIAKKLKNQFTSIWIDVENEQALIQLNNHRGTLKINAEYLPEDVETELSIEDIFEQAAGTYEELTFEEVDQTVRVKSITGKISATLEKTPDMPYIWPELRQENYYNIREINQFEKTLAIPEHDGFIFTRDGIIAESPTCVAVIPANIPAGEPFVYIPDEYPMVDDASGMYIIGTRPVFEDSAGVYLYSPVTYPVKKLPVLPNLKIQHSFELSAGFLLLALQSAGFRKEQYVTITCSEPNKLTIVAGPNFKKTIPANTGNNISKDTVLRIPPWFYHVLKHLTSRKHIMRIHLNQDDELLLEYRNTFYKFK